jgi:hypothetical protein
MVTDGTASGLPAASRNVPEADVLLSVSVTPPLPAGTALPS